jgi:hypothetical protein
MLKSRNCLSVHEYTCLPSYSWSIIAILSTNFNTLISIDFGTILHQRRTFCQQIKKQYNSDQFYDLCPILDSCGNVMIFEPNNAKI